MGFGVTVAFMCIALVMAFVLRYLLAKYPYPVLYTDEGVPSDVVDDKSETA